VKNNLTNRATSDAVIIWGVSIILVFAMLGGWVLGQHYTGIVQEHDGALAETLCYQLDGQPEAIKGYLTGAVMNGRAGIVTCTVDYRSDGRYRYTFQRGRDGWVMTQNTMIPWQTPR